jgi:hypothetical protein
MGGQIEQGVRSQQRQSKQTPPVLGLRLVRIVVYAKNCRVGQTLSLDDLAATDIGDWTMPDFRAASRYAASQGWLIVQDDAVTLKTAGLAAA